MKLYDVEFDPMYPVPSGLLINAKTKKRALEIALETVKHEQEEPITIKNIIEVEGMDTEGVIFYESGDY